MNVLQKVHTISHAPLHVNHYSPHQTGTHETHWTCQLPCHSIVYDLRQCRRGERSVCEEDMLVTREYSEIHTCEYRVEGGSYSVNPPPPSLYSTPSSWIATTVIQCITLKAVNKYSGVLREVEYQRMSGAVVTERQSHNILSTLLWEDMCMCTCIQDKYLLVHNTHFTYRRQTSQ